MFALWGINNAECHLVTKHFITVLTSYKNFILYTDAPVLYENWLEFPRRSGLRGEPSGAQDCMAITNDATSSNVNKWSSENCTDKFGVVCKIGKSNNKILLPLFKAE